MVSFCDVTLAYIKINSNYGQYGIGLKNYWATSNKMNPVLYLDKHSHVATGTKRILDFVHSENMDSKTSEASTWLIQHFKARALKLELKDGIRDIDCYNEREWRYVPQIEAVDVSKYPGVIYPDEYEDKLKPLGDKPHFDSKYAAKFNLEDIVFITVKSHDEVEQIMNLFPATADELLRNKIFVVEEIS